MAAPVKAPAKNINAGYKTPKGSSSLPQWAKEIRAGANFIPKSVKPVSYNYMNLVETPNRKVIYGSSNPSIEGNRHPYTPATSALAVGTYHRPTDEVGKGIKQNYNTIQDIKNIGGEVAGRLWGALKRVGDVLARPQYALMNDYKKNTEHWYKGANSAGGTRVTGGEQIQSLLFGLTPAGLIRDTLAGRLDDRAKALWGGFSGKEKTLTGDILKTQTPGFVKEHPKLAMTASIGGDFFLDPLILAGVVTKPGSVVRAVGAGGNKMFGKKEAAARLWSESFFSAKGREGAVNAMKQDFARSDLRKIDRKLAKIEKDAKRTNPRQSTAVRTAKTTQLKDLYSARLAQDLKGSALAWRIAKSSLPTAGIGTISRLSTGAAAGSTALRGAKTLKEAHELHTAVTVDKLMDDPKWYATWQNHLKNPEDIHYQHGANGQWYTVDLSKAKSYKEFLTKIAGEAAPIAKYAEHGTKAARARKGKILIVEARGKDFITAFQRKIDREMTSALKPDELRLVTAKKLSKYETAQAKKATEDDLKDPTLVRVNEDDLPHIDYDALKGHVEETWGLHNPGVKYKETRSYVIVTDSAGDAKKVSLAALRRHANSSERHAASRAAGDAAVEARSPRQKALDDLTDIGNRTAARRAEMEEAYKAANAEGAGTEAIERAKKAEVNLNEAIKAQTAAKDAVQTAQAAQKADPKAHAIVKQVNDIIKNTDDLTTEKHTELLGILANGSIPMAQRISQVLNDPAIDNAQAASIIKKVFTAYIKDNRLHVSTTGEGSGFESIPQILDLVMRDRFGARITEGMQQASNLTLDELSLQIAKMDQLVKTPDYMRDINAEVGMLVLDGYRQALETAVKSEELMSDPKKMFASVNNIMVEFMNHASADTKAQVSMLLFNMTGIRLPENFVPTAERVANLIAAKQFQFKKADGTLADQANAWRSFGILAQDWVTNAFSFVPAERFTTTTGVSARTGKNMEKFLNDMKRLAQQTGLNDTPNGQKILALRARVDALNEGLVSLGRGTIQSANGPVEAVNRYTPLDFLIHHKSIMKAQTTTLVVGKNKAGQTVNTVQAGRLSALDSFSFVDDTTKDGLSAIETLKNIAKNDSEIGKMARRELADLFIASGGEQHIMGLIPHRATGDLSQLNYNPMFQSLGVHAALKEEAVSGAFEAGWRADLLESMWDRESLFHNWQKAFQNKILHDVYINGMTHETSAKKMAENIKETFENHEKVKRLLYPVKKEVEKTDPDTGVVSRVKEELAPSTLQGLGKNLQKSWGNNPIETARNQPGVVNRAPAKFEAPEGVDPQNLNLDKLAPKTKEQAFTQLKTALGEKVARQLIDPRHGAVTITRIRNAEGKVVGRVVEQNVKQGSRITGTKIRVHMNGSDVIGEPATIDELPDLFKGAIEDPRAPHKAAVPGDEYAPNAVLANKPLIVNPKAIKAPGAVASVAEDAPELVTAAAAFDASTVASKANKTAKEAQVEYHDSLRAAGEASPVRDTAAADEIAADVKRLEAEQADKQMVYDATPEDPADFANVTSGKPDIDELDENAIADWIRAKYIEAPPDEVADHLEAVGRSLAADLLQAQAHMVTANLDLKFKHGANVNFMGAPLMGVGAPTNPFMPQAGVTAFNVQRSWATKMLAKKFQLVPQAGETMTKGQEFYTKTVRMSKVLEGTLNRIRAGVVNESEVSRKTVIGQINDWYVAGLNNGKFINTNIASMSKRQRRDYVIKAFFDENLGKVPDRLDEFGDASGRNIAKEIEADFTTISRELFSRRDRAKNLAALRTFNRYLDKKFQFDDSAFFELDKIDDSIPIFSRQWIIEANKVVPQSKLATKNIDLAELHYSMHDAKLKVRTGQMLHEGVFEEFAFVMDSKLAEHYNKTVPVETKGARGKIVSLNNLREESRVGIPDNYIPTEMKGGKQYQYYIDAEILPEIKFLFDYMDGVHAINDTLNVGFIDKVLSYFKASVTIYKVPTYPVKNTISDLFMGAMDGLLNPKYYKWAAEVQMGNHKAMKEVDAKDYEGLLDQRFLSAENAKAAHDPTTVKQIDEIVPDMSPRLTILTADGHYKLNDAQIMALYEELGLGQNRVAGNFVESVAGTRKSGTSRQAGKVHDLFKNTNDVREDWGRLAHFMYALEKEAPLGGGFEEVIRRAGDRVMKYHFDYGDVSIWERNSLARQIPFYKWVKNVVPFTIASIVTKPRYFMAEKAINEATGYALNDDKEDVGFKDFVMPEYMDGQNAVSTGWMMDNVGNKFNQYMVMNLPLSETMFGTIAPVLDPWLQTKSGANPRDRVIESGKGFASVSGAMMNPLIQGGVQAATGMKMWSTGASPEREGEDWMKTMSAAIPGFATLDSFNKQLHSGDKTEGMSGTNARAALVDALGAGRIMNNTEQAQLGSLNVTEDRLQGSLKARKAVIAKRVKEKWPHLTEEQSMLVVDEYIKQQRVTSGTHL